MFNTLLYISFNMCGLIESYSSRYLKRSLCNQHLYICVASSNAEQISPESTESVACNVSVSRNIGWTFGIVHLFELYRGIINRRFVPSGQHGIFIALFCKSANQPYTERTGTHLFQIHEHKHRPSPGRSALRDRHSPFKANTQTPIQSII